MAAAFPGSSEQLVVRRRADARPSVPARAREDHRRLERGQRRLLHPRPAGRFRRVGRARATTCGPTTRCCRSTRRARTISTSRGEFHGQDGPMPDHARRAASSCARSRRRSSKRACARGFRRIRTRTLRASKGSGRSRRNATDGIRMNTAMTYLALARDRPNLTVLGETLRPARAVRGDASGRRRGRARRSARRVPRRRGRAVRERHQVPAPAAALGRRARRRAAQARDRGRPRQPGRRPQRQGPPVGVPELQRPRGRLAAAARRAAAAAADVPQPHRAGLGHASANSRSGARRRRSAR